MRRLGLLALALALGARAAAENSSAVEFCDNDPASCTLCPKGSSAIAFDLSGLRDRVDMQSYSIHVPPAKAFVASPCGLTKDQGIEDLVPEYDSSACTASGTNQFCFCHPEADPHDVPPRCRPLGPAERATWTVFEEAPEKMNPGAQDKPAEAHAIVRAVFKPTDCPANCAECTSTVVYHCNPSVPENSFTVAESTTSTERYCFARRDLCSPCITVSTPNVCQYHPCPNGCSGHGKCDAMGVCRCSSPDWVGADCGQTPECMEAGDCSHFAQCAPNPLRGPICACLPGWEGDGHTCSPLIRVAPAPPPARRRPPPPSPVDETWTASFAPLFVVLALSLFFLRHRVRGWLGCPEPDADAAGAAGAAARATAPARRRPNPTAYVPADEGVATTGGAPTRSTADSDDDDDDTASAEERGLLSRSASAPAPPAPGPGTSPASSSDSAASPVRGSDGDSSTTSDPPRPATDESPAAPDSGGSRSVGL